MSPHPDCERWEANRTLWLLLRRDWILNRVAVLTTVFVFATFQVLFVQIPLDLPYIWLFVVCVWGSALTITPITREDKFRGAPWSCTLPVSRPELVRARYIGAWALAAGAYLVAVAVAVLTPGSKVSPAFTVDLDALLIGAAIVSTILVFVLPAVVRFGVKGVLVLLVPLNIVLPVLFVVSKATGTQDDVEGGLLAGLQAMADVIVGIRDGLPLPFFYLAVIVLLFAVNWAGYRLAVALVRRREI